MNQKSGAAKAPAGVMAPHLLGDEARRQGVHGHLQ